MSLSTVDPREAFIKSIQWRPLATRLEEVAMASKAEIGSQLFLLDEARGLLDKLGVCLVVPSHGTADTFSTRRTVSEPLDCPGDEAVDARSLRVMVREEFLPSGYAGLAGGWTVSAVGVSVVCGNEYTVTMSSDLVVAQAVRDAESVMLPAASPIRRDDLPATKFAPNVLLPDAQERSRALASAFATIRSHLG